jgi:hypothetical protein
VEWILLVIGAAVGAVLGLLANEMWRWHEARRERRQRAERYRELNLEAKSIEAMHSTIVLIQAGWDPDGFFRPGSITVRLDGTYQTPPAVQGIREARAAEWLEAGHTDGRQVGLSSYLITRVSDDPEQERRGLAHHLVLKAHEFDYFDFMASHRVLLHGTGAERHLLARLAASASAESPAPGLPTPCSVGLSLIAEGGRTIVLSRRAGRTSPAGSWRHGQVFNAVGEGMAARDFASAGYDAASCGPDITAVRGAYEELGFRAEEMQWSTVRLHSFAFATDLLDFKFFGCLETELSVGEIQGRWEVAPDRSEARELLYWPIETRQQAIDLLREMDNEADTWSPEARFCTIRTLLCLRKVSFQDVVAVSAEAAAAAAAR